jgi:4-hydroxybenzoate polyprenyltransferase
MISPLKDIAIALTLGLGAGMIWNNYKDGEMDRISRFYKWYDAQEAQKKNAHADD